MIEEIAEIIEFIMAFVAKLGVILFLYDVVPVLFLFLLVWLLLTFLSKKLAVRIYLTTLFVLFMTEYMYLSLAAYVVTDARAKMKNFVQPAHVKRTVDELTQSSVFRVLDEVPWIKRVTMNYSREGYPHFPVESGIYTFQIRDSIDPCDLTETEFLFERNFKTQRAASVESLSDELAPYRLCIRAKLAKNVDDAFEYKSGSYFTSIPFAQAERYFYLLEKDNKVFNYAESVHFYKGGLLTIYRKHSIRLLFDENYERLPVIGFSIYKDKLSYSSPNINSYTLGNFKVD